MEKFGITNPTYFTRDAVNGIIQPRTSTDKEYLFNNKQIYSNSDDALIKNLSFYKSRGTYASPSVITTGDYLGEIVGYGHDGTNYIRSGSIRFKSRGTIGTNRVPSQIEFWISTDVSPSVETSAVTITSSTGINSSYGFITSGNYQGLRNNIGATSSDSFYVANETASLVSTPVQMSPRLRFRGSAWDTDDAVSRTSDWIIENLPATGNTVSSTLRFGHSLAGGSYTYPMTLDSTGAMRLLASVFVGSGAIFSNTNDAYGFFSPGYSTRGNLIKRDIADAYSTLTINNANASSTGNILDLQWQGVNRISFTKNGSINLNTTDALGAGTININGNRYFHAYSPVVADSNLFSGYNSGNFTMTGTIDQASYNVGVGRLTLNAITTGSRNLAIGNVALAYNTSGSDNVGIGNQALFGNISTSNNVSIGSYSLGSNISSNNSAIGTEAFRYNTTGTGLVAVGYQAGKFNVKGTNNTYLGYQAGYSGTTVVSSITITNGGTGYTAGALIVNNTGTGGSGLAGTYTVDGSGVINGITITNVGSGYNSVPTVTPQPGGSSAVLTPALSSAGNNTAIGYQSLYSTTRGADNVALGVGALYSNIIGNNNTAFGDYALYNATGTGNQAQGTYAGRNQTSGNYNIYLGQESAYKSGVTTTGSGNVFMGYQTGINNTASNNVFIGYQAGYSNTSGIENTLIGYQSGYTSTDASGVTSFGYRALRSATGGYNTAFGGDAGVSITTGSQNTFLGRGAGYNASQLATATNSMALGYGAYTTASNQIVLGNASVTQILCGQDSQAEVKAGKLETTVAGEGIILKSPDGTRYKITVANDGIVTSTAV